MIISKLTTSFFLITSILFFFNITNYKANAQCDPGKMKDEVKFACGEDLVYVKVNNQKIEEGCAFAYILLDNTAGVTTDYIDYNSGGVFMKNEKAFYDDPYYAFSVVGRDENGDGLPDLNNDNLKLSNNSTEVIFLTTIEIIGVQVCDIENGSQELVLAVDGGFAGFDYFSFTEIITPGDILANSDGSDFIYIQPESSFYFTRLPPFCSFNLEFEPEHCLNDLALTATLQDDQTTIVKPGEIVEINVEVFNQGSFVAKDIGLICYLTKNITSSDNNWNYNLSDFSSETKLEFLQPGESKTIDISLEISNYIEIGNHNIFFEISSSNNITGMITNDYDSTPDNDRYNDVAVDDVIDNSFNDEDDHDLVTFFVNANNNYSQTIQPVSVDSSDCLVLKAMYNATNGENWHYNSGWRRLLNSNIDSAIINYNIYGVTFDNDGRVSEIDLRHNNLENEIPAEIYTLKNLKKLYLSNNRLSGEIPQIEQNLNNLTDLDLSNNNLNGDIPVSISNAPNLNTLNFSFNNLSKEIPNQLSKLEQLIYLNLSNNKLQGIIPDFSTFNVEVLQIENNTFSSQDILDQYEENKQLYHFSTSPQTLGNKQFYIVGSERSISLSIPFSTSNYANVDYQWKHNYDSIPDGISRELLLDQMSPKDEGKYTLHVFDKNCATLFNSEILQVDLKHFYCHIDDWKGIKALYESTNGKQWQTVAEQVDTINTGRNNSFQNVFSDSIPPPNCNLGKLEGISLNLNARVAVLNLNNNKLSGTIPAGIDKLNELVELQLMDNDLTGYIPPALGNMKDLKFINLASNNLWGKIPPEIGELTELNYLRLDQNNLSGIIPPEFGNLKGLVDLRLNQNNLTGNIPKELSEIDYNVSNDDFYLWSLDLSHNKLTGTIPEEFEIFDEVELKLNNNHLSGKISLPERLHQDTDIRNNYFTCDDITNYTINNSQDSWWTSLSPQYFGQIKTYIFDTLYNSQSLQLSTINNVEDETNVSYQWIKNGMTLPNETTPILTIDILKPESAGQYNLHITKQCSFESVKFISDPLYVLIKGYDLYGQPVNYNQIMVEFDGKKEREQYEDEILTPNAGIVKHACNCNRELYLWEFPDTEAAIAALLEIDKKTKRLKKKNKPNGGFNNSLSIGDSVKNKVAYRVFLDEINQNFKDSVVVYILDSGLDSLNINSPEFIYDQAPVDACYESDAAPGYSYTDSLVISTNYTDDLWHGTFGFESITQDITAEKNPLKIVPLKIFNDKGEGSLFDLVCAMYHAIDHNADIINISAGYQGEASGILEKAIRSAREKGIFITAAAGNDTLDIDSISYYPAYYASQYDVYETIDANLQVALDSVQYDNLISIASINANDSLSQFSNYGSETVSLATYGENIHGYTLGGTDAVASGTSMATYFATKALALEISKDRNRDYQQVWNDFEENWLLENPMLAGKTQTGKQINFKIEETDIEGCTDPGDPNYFLFATVDDGSCLTDVDQNYNSYLNDVAIYPNPTKEKVFLNFNQVHFSLARIQVFNLQGNQILEKAIKGQNIIELNLSGFLKGVYLIQITTGMKRVVRKLVVQ